MNSTDDWKINIELEVDKFYEQVRRTMNAQRLGNALRAMNERQYTVPEQRGPKCRPDGLELYGWQKEALKDTYEY